MATGNRDTGQPPELNQFQPDKEDTTHDLIVSIESWLRRTEKELEDFVQKHRFNSHQEPYIHLLQHVLRKLNRRTEPPEKWVPTTNNAVKAVARSDRVHHSEVISYLRSSLQIRHEIQRGLSVGKVRNKSELRTLQNTLGVLRRSQQRLTVRLSSRARLSRSLYHPTKERRSFGAFPASFSGTPVPTHQIESNPAVPTWDNTSSRIAETNPVPAGGSGIDGSVANSVGTFDRSGLEPEYETRTTKSVANSQSGLNEYDLAQQHSATASILVQMRTGDR